MNIKQVDLQYVMNHLGDENIFRIVACSEIHKGANYAMSVRIKPLKHMNVKELNYCQNNDNIGFIQLTDLPVEQHELV